MNIKHFFDRDTGTLTYIVEDTETKQCAVIDPILNFDISSGRISEDGMNQVIQYIENNHLSLQWILETHVHADHLSGSQILKNTLGGKIAIGEHLQPVFEVWNPIFNCHETGDLFDELLKENVTIKIGNIAVRPIHTPGHTPTCMSYVIENNVFVGDTLFSPKRGTARTDFPGGSAATLYNSIQKILGLGDDVNVYLCHDYPDKNSEPDYVTTVGEQRKNNVFINDTINKETFIAQRNKRDATLPAPKLILPALQVNMRAGKLPEPEDNEKIYLKIPIAYKN